MKRLDYIKKLYKTQMLKEIFANDEDARKELLEMGIDPDDVEIDPDEFDETFEDEPEAKPEEKPEVEPEEKPEVEPEEKQETPKPEVEPEEKQETPKPEEYLEMPNVRQKDFQFSEGATIAKICPVCGYKNRPIYLKECENCARIYKSVQKIIARAQKDPDYQYDEEQVIRNLANKFKYINEEELREIIQNKGRTTLSNEDVYNIQSSAKKQLEDALHYRLNVKKDEKGDPIIHKKTGLPIPLEKKKYFSTSEITDALHLSPEKFRELIAEHNEKVIKNLPEEAQKYIRKDEFGELIPMSPKMLEPYGFVAPALIFGTGMADKFKRPTGDPQSPEEEEAQRGPASKSVDLAAWNWEKIAPAFGWDKEQKQFTSGWGKFLKEQFLPGVKKQKAENELNALLKLIEKYQNIANTQIENARDQWKSPKNIGLRVHSYFQENPGLTVDEFREEWEDEYTEYLQDRKKVFQVRDIDKKLPPKIRKALENFDAHHAEMSEEEYSGFVSAIAGALRTSEEKIRNHLELRKDAQHIEEEKPKEMDFMLYLNQNPKMTRETLAEKYEPKKLRFLKNVYEKAQKTKEEYENRAEELKAKIPELELAIQEFEIPEDFDLNEAVRQFGKKPMIEMDTPAEEKEYQELIDQENKNNPLSTPKKEGSRLERIKKLAVIAELYNDDEEDNKKVDINVNEWMEGTPKTERAVPFGNYKKLEPPPIPKSEYEPRKKEVPKPSWGKTEQKEIKKFVIRRTMIRITVPKKDASGRTIYNVDPITNERKEETKQIFIPRLDHHIITFRTDEDGNITHATCEKIKSVQYKPTGKIKQKPASKGLLAIARRQVREEAKESGVRLPRDEYMEKVKEKYIQLTEQEGVEAYVPVPIKEPSLPSSLSSATTTPCEECPRGTYIRDGVPVSGCKEIEVAIKATDGLGLPSGYEVKNLDEVRRREPKWSQEEERTMRQQNNVTDFFADDHISLQPSYMEGPMTDAPKKKQAAEYQGRKVKLNDPIRNPSGSKKKFKVYVRDPKSGKVKKVQFGDPNMKIKRDDPERRKSFRARHKCDTAKDKTKARYWSCWQWRKNKKVDN